MPDARLSYCKLLNLLFACDW